MRAEEIKGLMRSLGARRSEISVYIALLRMRSEAPISKILERVNLSEKTVRTALDSLIRRGLVVRTGKGRGTKYRARGARTLMRLVKKKIEEGVQEIFTHLQYRSS